jgi:hypothetical protein
MKGPGPKRKGQHRWKGELAKPLFVGVGITSLNEIASKETSDRLQQAIRGERIEKLVLLAKHYGIDETDYLGLALALAAHHIPGFQVASASKLFRLQHGDYGEVLGSKQRRRRKWPQERQDRLLTAVEKIKKDRRLSTDREALRIAIRQDEWKPPSNHRGDLEQWRKTLANQLSAARAKTK